MDIIDALKIIIAHSPRASEQAIRTIAAVRNNSPVIQIRYANVLIMALADPEADFTQAEREILASAIEPSETTTRNIALHVRLTPGEQAELEQAAETAGQSLSEYVRRRLF